MLYACGREREREIEVRGRGVASLPPTFIIAGYCVPLPPLSLSLLSTPLPASSHTALWREAVAGVAPTVCVLPGRESMFVNITLCSGKACMHTPT